MKEHKYLKAQTALVAGVAMLVTASAFADSRHSEGTRSRDGDRGSARSEWRRGNSPSNDRGTGGNRNFDRRGDRRGDSRFNRRETNFSENHFRDNRFRGDNFRDNRFRGDSRFHRGQFNGSRQPFFAFGHVRRIVPFGGGFRVWIGGAPYPFFIPEAYYYAHHLRLGLSIRLGGYYNPGGYYDYYDGAYSAGDLRGVVESVDYRRGTFVVRNDASGSFVTVAMRDGGRDVRAGDYVEVTGDWTRTGVFQAYDVRLLDNSTYQR